MSRAGLFNLLSAEDARAAGVTPEDAGAEDPGAWLISQAMAAALILAEDLNTDVYTAGSAAALALNLSAAEAQALARRLAVEDGRRI